MGLAGRSRVLFDGAIVEGVNNPQVMPIIEQVDLAAYVLEVAFSGLTGQALYEARIDAIDEDDSILLEDYFNHLLSVSGATNRAFHFGPYLRNNISNDFHADVIEYEGILPPRWQFVFGSGSGGLASFKCSLSEFPVNR